MKKINLRIVLVALCFSFLLGGYTTVSAQSLVTSNDNLTFSTTVAGEHAQTVNVKGSNLLVVNLLEDFDVTLSGPNANQFRVVRPSLNLLSILGALLGDGYDIQIIYEPSVPGPHQAVVHVTGDILLIGLLEATINLNGNTTSSDVTAPRVVSTTPSNGSIGITTSTAIKITYDEPITIANASGITVNGSTNALVSVSGNALTITPGATLTVGVNYTVQVAAGAVKDAAGNATISDYKLSFTTVALDIIPPSVISTSPSYNAANVTTNTAITFTYNEQIAIADASRITMSQGVGFKTSVYGNVLTIIPTTALNPSTTYQITIGSGAVKDATGNATASSDLLTFSTAAQSSTPGNTDTTAPVIVSTSPANNATGITSDIQIVMTYSEEISVANPDGITINGSRAQTTISGNSLIIHPATPLTPGTAYTIRVAPGSIKDAANNVTTTSYQLSFATTSGTPGGGGTPGTSDDTTAPTILSTLPADNGTLDLGNPIVITYSEPVFLTDPSLIKVSGGISVNINISGNTVTITPIGGLTAGNTYTVEIGVGAFQDDSGNKTGSRYAFSFTASADTGIDDIIETKEIESEEFYTISGVRIYEPIDHQIYIHKINYVDGTTKVVKKLMIK